MVRVETFSDLGLNWAATTGNFISFKSIRVDSLALKGVSISRILYVKKEKILKNVLFFNGRAIEQSFGFTNKIDQFWCSIGK